MDLSAAAKLNRERLEKRFNSADRRSHQWLVECRDLGDAFDKDAGVYFVACENESTVNQLIANKTDDNMYDRVLSIFDLRNPLSAQGVGVTRAEWISGLKSKK